MAVADFDKLADDFVVLEQVAVVVDLDELADLEVEVAVVLLFDEFADFVVEVVVVALLRVVALGLEEPVDFVVPELFEGLGMLFVLDRLSDFAPLKEHFLGECPLYMERENVIIRGMCTQLFQLFT